MTTFFQRISFDKFFKTCLLVLMLYFSLLLSKIANRAEKESNFERFQLHLNENAFGRDEFIFDTRTGETILFEHPSKTQFESSPK